MAWYKYVLSAAGGLAVGVAVAYINMLLSKKVMRKADMASIMGINILRLTLDAATLAAVFFVCRAIGFPCTVPLMAAAFGLSIIGMLFLELMTKKPDAENEASDYGGE